jgi:hypothetical protein
VLAVHGLPGGVRAMFTTRRGGTSDAPYASLNLGAATGDDPRAVRANRLALARAAGFDPARAVALRQVHGAEVIEVGADCDVGFAEHLTGIGDADALVTGLDGVALVVQAADCVPVLLWRRDATTVGAVHAGWRGLVAGVLPAAVSALGPGEVDASIGPCIGACCYPVDATLRDRMATLFGADVVVGEAVDLRLAARRALTGAGLDGEGIGDVAACTSCDEGRFFSYRRDGARTGRQAGVIWRVAS